MAIYSKYCLRIRGADEVSRYPLPYGTTMIGSDSICDLLLADRAVAGRQAQIVCRQEDDSCTLTDLGSQNRTLLNNEPLPPNLAVRLQLNAQIKIGMYRLIFETSVTDDEDALAVESALVAPQLHKPTFDLYEGVLPPGFSSIYSLKLLAHLPMIYQPVADTWLNHAETTGVDRSAETFLMRFLGLFESVLLPLQWLIENFDLYLDVRTAPLEFWPWLEHWYGLPLDAQFKDDPTMVERRRYVLSYAHALYAQKGTSIGLQKLLRVCIDDQLPVEIDDQTQSGTFTITIGTTLSATKRALVERLIEAFKPVDVTYTLLPK
jgi:phage tail-like protein